MTSVEYGVRVLYVGGGVRVEGIVAPDTTLPTLDTGGDPDDALYTDMPPVVFDAWCRGEWCYVTVGVRVYQDGFLVGDDSWPGVEAGGGVDVWELRTSEPTPGGVSYPSPMCMAVSNTILDVLERGGGVPGRGSSRGALGDVLRYFDPVAGGT